MKRGGLVTQRVDTTFFVRLQPGLEVLEGHPTPSTPYVKSHWSKLQVFIHLILLKIEVCRVFSLPQI